MAAEKDIYQNYVYHVVTLENCTGKGLQEVRTSKKPEGTDETTKPLILSSYYYFHYCGKLRKRLIVKYYTSFHLNY